MKVGVSSVNITPPVGFLMAGYAARKGFSSGIHDDLYAKVLVFDDGKEKAALVRCDLLGLQHEIVEKARKLVHLKTGIDEKNIMISCTHTHSGPETRKPFSIFSGLEQWLDVLTRKIEGAVVMACYALTEAKIGAGRGFLEQVVINRRRPGGPVDPEVGVVRIDDVRGNPLAMMVNYTCHAVVLGYDNLLYSADYPGYVDSFLEDNLGVPTLFVNGSCGDINPLDKLAKIRQEKKQDIYGRGGGTFEEARRIGTMIGAEALKVFHGIETLPDADVKVASKAVKIPLKSLPSYLEAKETMEKNSKIFDKLVSEGDDVEQIFRAAMSVRYAKNSLDCLRSGGKFTEVQVFNIGGAGLVGLPGEVFVEIGLNIKEKSSLEHTFILEQANDSIGYIPTPDAFKEPGYEVGVAEKMHYAEQIGNIMEDSALDAIMETLRD